ncbi:hypothetical protein EXIGLDRAFT_781163 [Exidia glandulosa HHB12029]|uniref:Uncharacterized protein n=1 Tax=Exidia glandulosa HHB12029 TaxID=1314781 RepID=A0A165BC38_EXIGL|nr:hypothetical protein EXIGLDRAFT_781163 [Exidia glandulosa HHB12029]
MTLSTRRWEFLVSFWFDKEFFTGKRPFRWTFIVYFLARYLILLGLIAGVRITNAFQPINCVVWNYLVYSCAHACFACASLLLLLRVFAIGQWNRWITIPLGAFYLANVGTLVHTVAMTESEYKAELFLCGASNTVASRINVFTSFVFDLTCLITMLTLLMRERGLGIWKFLVQQGVVYFMVATALYLFSSIFLILNLNDAMNEIPQTASGTWYPVTDLHSN